MGSAANLNIAPAGALAIGIGSGCLSTLGYAYSQPYFEKTIGLRDTCGVINLHAGPGIMGGIAAGKLSSTFLMNISKGSFQQDRPLAGEEGDASAVLQMYGYNTPEIICRISAVFRIQQYFQKICKSDDRLRCLVQ